MTKTCPHKKVIRSHRAQQFGHLALLRIQKFPSGLRGRNLRYKINSMSSILVILNFRSNNYFSTKMVYHRQSSLVMMQSSKTEVNYPIISLSHRLNEPLQLIQTQRVTLVNIKYLLELLIQLVQMPTRQSKQLKQVLL